MTPKIIDAGRGPRVREPGEKIGILKQDQTFNDGFFPVGTLFTIATPHQVEAYINATSDPADTRQILADDFILVFLGRHKRLLHASTFALVPDAAEALPEAPGDAERRRELTSSLLARARSAPWAF